MTIEFTKHNQSNISPVDINAKVQVETFASLGRDIFYAWQIDWKLVKFYRVVT